MVISGAEVKPDAAEASETKETVCLECGAALPENAAFCAFCGKKITQEKPKEVIVNRKKFFVRATDVKLYGIEKKLKAQTIIAFVVAGFMLVMLGMMFLPFGYLNYFGQIEISFISLIKEFRLYIEWYQGITLLTKFFVILLTVTVTIAFVCTIVFTFIAFARGIKCANALSSKNYDSIDLNKKSGFLKQNMAVLGLSILALNFSMLLGNRAGSMQIANIVLSLCLAAFLIITDQFFVKNRIINLKKFISSGVVIVIAIVFLFVSSGAYITNNSHGTGPNMYLRLIDMVLSGNQYYKMSLSEVFAKMNGGGSYPFYDISETVYYYSENYNGNWVFGFSLGIFNVFFYLMLGIAFISMIKKAIYTFIPETGMFETGKKKRKPKTGLASLWGLIISTILMILAFLNYARASNVIIQCGGTPSLIGLSISPMPIVMFVFMLINFVQCIMFSSKSQKKLNKINNTSV